MQCIIPNPGWGGGGGGGGPGAGSTRAQEKITYARSARFMSNKLELLVENFKTQFPPRAFQIYQ